MNAGKKVTLGSLLAALICSISYLWFTYQSGCTADLKTASGDAMKAIQLAEYGFVALTISLFFYGMAIWFSSKDRKSVKLIAVPVILSVVLIIFWVLGFLIESEAVATCH